MNRPIKHNNENINLNELNYFEPSDEELEMIEEEIEKIINKN
ncbi:hypothetical protein OAI93_00290 [bacterium]|jgi:hypothetical protein|nr:hypothetical protein [bacterium]|tara:strand:+ start:2527 stop:2652 length:126 start_codon:yes stop_codon:yes gene_type:complete